MLTLTVWLIGVAMVVGSVALVVGLCVLPAPPRRGGHPPKAPARRPVR
jgi:hypothetical protein